MLAARVLKRMVKKGVKFGGGRSGVESVGGTVGRCSLTASSVDIVVVYGIDDWLHGCVVEGKDRDAVTPTTLCLFLAVSCETKSTCCRKLGLR